MKHLRCSVKDVTERVKDYTLVDNLQTHNHLRQPVYAFLSTTKLDLENSTTDLLLTIHEHLHGIIRQPFPGL